MNDGNVMSIRIRNTLSIVAWAAALAKYTMNDKISIEKGTLHPSLLP